MTADTLARKRWRKELKRRAIRAATRRNGRPTQETRSRQAEASVAQPPQAPLYRPAPQRAVPIIPAPAKPKSLLRRIIGM